jgi:uncharacterized protein
VADLQPMFERIERWREAELPHLPASQDRRLIEGLQGERYLFDTRSGLSVELLGPAAVLMAALLEEAEPTTVLMEEAARFSPPDVLEAMEQCSELLRLLRAEQTAPPGRERARPGYNLSLNVGMGCNLKCSYCDPLGYREKTHGQVMSEETARQALDFLFNQVPDGGVGCVTYSIGGEPLLYRRLLGLVAEYTRALRDRGIRATQYLNTNGLLLTDGALEFLRVNDINFGISLDGPPEAHDAHRVLPDGQGTYERVRGASEKVLDRFPHASVSAVITAAFPRPLEIYRHLLGLGFQRIIVKPVRGRPHEAHAFTPENLPALLQGYREYAAFFVEELASGRREIYAAINPHDYFARFVLRIFRREKHTYRCGAASMANLTVAPDGSFYPCEGFVGQEEYRLGDVATGFDAARMDRFSRLYVDEKPMCRECWARYQCGGGCYLSGLMVNGDISTPDPAECELTRFLVELAVGTLHAAEAIRPEALIELREWCDAKGWYGRETLISRMPPPRSALMELPMLG